MSESESRIQKVLLNQLRTQNLTLKILWEFRRKQFSRASSIPSKSVKLNHLYPNFRCWQFHCYSISLPPKNNLQFSIDLELFVRFEVFRLHLSLSWLRCESKITGRKNLIMKIIINVLFKHECTFKFSNFFADGGVLIWAG